MFLPPHCGCALQWFSSKELQGFYFTDKGFDCWFINFRGNILNLSHKNTNISYEEFFDFSYDDLGQKDVPTCIDNILKITKKSKLTLVTMSAGGLVGNIALTDKFTHKKINSLVDEAIFLCPSLLLTYHQDYKLDTHYNNLKTYDWVIKKSKEWNVHHTGFGAYHSDNNLSGKFVEYIDSLYPNFDMHKTDLIGFDGKTDRCFAHFLKKDLLWILFPFLKFLGHPGLRSQDYGTSLKCYIHLAQNMTGERRYTKKLYAYDYMSEKNKQKYGTEQCPEYDLTNINIPISVIAGGKDKFCNLEAAKVFAELVNTHNKNENVKCFCLEDWRHLSF